jgi:transposase
VGPIRVDIPKPGIGPIAAATLIAEVGSPFRFPRELKFARCCSTGAVALSYGEGDRAPIRHRLDFGGNRRINSVLYIASVTQPRDVDDARVYIDRKLGEGKTRREARRAHKRHFANRVIRRMGAAFAVLDGSPVATDDRSVTRKWRM